jgi:crotonobetainyl-CoA:carnitine CoA-transferase CaiB-like acyl-CoA transferase
VSAALEGLRVLDLSRVLAGPYCTQLLGDLGADVVKIEPPWGDETRAWGPPFLRDAHGRETRDSAYFAAVNRNKRSVVLDLKTTEGREAARRLAERADVVVENFRVGELAAWGLDYESLARTNSRLVFCSITGFGQDGPRAAEPGYDFMMQAMSGLMSITGTPEGEPTKVGVALVDVVTGLHAATAILAALQARQTRGRGQHIDIALFDSALAALVNQAQGFLATGDAPARHGNAHPSIVPYETFATRDGTLALAVGNDEQFARLCTALEQPQLASDPRYARNPDRVRHRTQLREELGALFASRSTGDWLRRCAAGRLAASPVNDIAQAFADPQVHARQMRASVAGAACDLVGSPLKLSSTPVSYRRAPPKLGEHTGELMTGW